MITILTPAQNARCDAYSIEAAVKEGNAPDCFMERAAAACADAFAEEFPDCRRVLVLCGTGNNGGDGLAAARILTERGYQAEICLPDPAGKRSDGFCMELARAEAAGVPVVPFASLLPLSSARYDAVIDALFGTGLARPLDGAYAQAVQALGASGLPVLSVDIPSGIDGRTGAVLSAAVRADVTVTMQTLKTGLCRYPGASYAGKIRIADIGIGYTALGEEPVISALTDADVPGMLPRRPADGNKGTMGHVLIAAGSVSMSGAAYLSAKAAYRLGAGLVRILTPEENRTILAGLLPEALITAYDANRPDPGVIASAVRWADVIVLGPGIGCDESAVYLAQTVLFCRSEKTGKTPGGAVILDADALNLLAAGRISLPDVCHFPLIFTPHPGELSRLTGENTAALLSDLVSHAEEYARTLPAGSVLCAKDARTVVTDGKTTRLNLSGCSALAKGGTGDVLTGIIAALCCAGCTPLDAASLGAYLHGKAGEILARKWGTRGVLASELPDAAAKALFAIVKE